MKYDDASWHYGGEFPADLPREAGATHIAMFVAWCVLNELGGELHYEDGRKQTDALRERRLTPTKWFLEACDEKFTDEDLTVDGNAFASNYYNMASDTPSEYISDYQRSFPGIKNLYEVPDTWVTYDRIAPLIARAAKKWRDRHSKRPWLRRWF